MKDSTKLEQAVISMLLEGNHGVLSILRDQARQARVVRREHTGVGFYCDIAVEDGAPKASGDFDLGDVQAEIPGVAHGVGFVLFVKGGQLNLLEGYTYDEPWPDAVSEFSLKYSDPKRTAELAKLG
jgi:hypothetical protein